MNALRLQLTAEQHTDLTHNAGVHSILHKLHEHGEALLG